MRKSVAVVLGGGVTCEGKPNAYTVERLKTAEQLFHENKVDCLILSGKGGHPKYNEAVSMYQWLAARDINQDNLFLETRSLNTFENALYTHHHYLKHMDIDTVYVITNAFHMERAMVIFNGVSNDNYPVTAKPAPDIDHSDIRAWKEKKGIAYYKEFFENMKNTEAFIPLISPVSHEKRYVL